MPKPINLTDTGTGNTKPAASGGGTNTPKLPKIIKPSQQSGQQNNTQITRLTDTGTGNTSPRQPVVATPRVTFSNAPRMPGKDRAAANTANKVNIAVENARNRSTAADVTQPVRPEMTQIRPTSGTPSRSLTELYTNTAGAAQDNGLHRSDNMASMKSRIDLMWHDRVQPAYQRYEQAMADYNAGKIDLDSAMSAYNDYMTEKYQYDPIQQAYETLLHSGDAGATDQSSYEDIMAAMDRWDQTIGEAETNLARMDSELERLSQQYTDAVALYDKNPSEIQARKVNTLREELLQKTAEQDAAWFVYSEMAGNFDGLNSAAEAAFRRDYPEVFWVQNIGRMDEAGNIQLTDSYMDVYDRIQTLRNKAETAESPAERDQYIREANWYQSILSTDEVLSGISEEELGSTLTALEGDLKTANARVSYLQNELDGLAFLGTPEDSEEYQALLSQMEKAEEQRADIQFQASTINRYYDRVAHENVLADLSEEAQDRFRALIEAGAATDLSAYIQYDRSMSAEQRAQLAMATPGLLEQLEEVRADLAEEGLTEDEVESMLYYAAREGNYQRAAEVRRGIYNKDALGNVTGKARDTGWLINFLSATGNSLMSGLGYVDLAMQGIGGRKDAFTGRSTVDYNTHANDYYQRQMAYADEQFDRYLTRMGARFDDEELAREKAQIRMNWYNLSMSMAQSTAIAGLTQLGVPGALLLLSGSAATQTAQQMHEQGYSDGAALVSGAISGFAEYITEKMALDKLLDGIQRAATKGLSPAQIFREAAIQIGAQGLTEGAEEGLSDIINRLGDDLVIQYLNGGISDIDMRARQIQQETGVSWKEAKAQAEKDWTNELYQDVKWGFVSGILMGGGGQALGAGMQALSDRSTGKAAIRSGNVEGLLELAGSMDRATAEAAGLRSDGELTTAYQIGHALNNIQSVFDIDAINTRLEALGEETISQDLLSAIDSAANGYRLLPNERVALRASQNGQKVVEELKEFRDAQSDFYKKNGYTADYKGFLSGFDGKENAWAADAARFGRKTSEDLRSAPDLRDYRGAVDSTYTPDTGSVRLQGDPVTVISELLRTAVASTNELTKILQNKDLRAEYEKQTGKKLPKSASQARTIMRENLASPDATPQEKQFIRTKNMNPDATVLGDSATALGKAGMVDMNKALYQGKLLDSIFNGEMLSPFDLRKLDLDNAAVRRVFGDRTGMINIPTNISSELKRSLVERAVSEVEKTRANQKAIADSAEELYEVQQAKAAEEMQRSVDEAKKGKKFRPAKTTRAERAQAIADAYETRKASAGRYRRIDLTNRTEADVVKQIRQQSGKPDLQAKSAFESWYRAMNKLDGELTKDQRAVLDDSYERYMLNKGLTVQERDALHEIYERAVAAYDELNTREVTVTPRARLQRQMRRGEGKVLYESNIKEATLSDQQKTGLAVLKRLAAKLGVTFHVYESTIQDDGKTRAWRNPNGDLVTDNGWYDPKTGEIWLDINAGAGGTGTVLFTAAHELTHWIRDWSPAKYKALAEFLLNRYADAGMKRSTVERLKLAQYLNAGVSLSIEEGTALEEAVADAMETMLTSPDVLQAIEDLNKVDSKLAGMIKTVLSKIIQTVQQVYASFAPDSAEGRFVANLEKDQLAELQKLFVEGLSDAAEQFQTHDIIRTNATPDTSIPQDGAFVDVDGKSYSIRSMKHDIAEGKMFEDLEASGMSHEDVMDLKNGLTDLVDFMSHAQFGTMTDEQWRRIIDMNEEYERDNRPFKPYKPNSDPLYTVSLDFSTLCRKRLLTQYVIEHLQTELQNGINGKTGRPLTAEEQLAVRDSLKEYRDQGRALQVACAMCYVEAARLKSPKVINQFLADPEAAMIRYYSMKNADFRKAVEQMRQDWKVAHGLDAKATKEQIKAKLGKKAVDRLQAEVDAMRDNYGNTEYISEEERKTIETAKSLPNTVFLTAANLAALAENEETKDIYAAFTTKVRAATRSKSLEADVPYYYGDSVYDPETDKGLSDTLIANLRRENGLRFSSWSDYQIQHMLDMMTAIIELSTRGASMHGYTKFLDQVRVFGKTGMMFNLSGVADGMGLDENGELIFSPSESVLVKSEDGSYDGLQARDEFPDTVGIQCIGISYEHILKLLDTDYIDYIIPYHTSGLNATLRKMAGIFGWKDFTFAQEERPIKDAKWDPSRCAEEDWQKHPSFSEWFTTEGKDGLDAMRRSAENYKKLCADRGLMPKFSTGNRSVNADFSNHPNYWKLLIDRKMINQKTGKLIEQKAVKPIFEFDRIKNEVKDYVANYDPDTEQKALDWVRNQLFNPDDPGALERRIAEMKATEKAKKDKKNKTPQQKLEELNVLDFATTAAVTKEALEDGTMKSIRDQHMEAFDAAVRATVDKAVSTGRWSSRNEITELYAKDPEAFIILELYKGGQAEKTARARFEAYLDTVDDLEFLSNLSWYPVQTIPTDSRKKIAGAIRKYQNMIKKRELAIKEAQVGGQNVGVEQREYSLQEVRELFNDLNQDKDVAELANKVFATAEKLGTRVYFTRSLKTKTGYTPKAYGISYGQTVQIRQDFMNGAQHSDQKKASAILHEIIHSCTTYVMKYKDLERLYSYGVSKELLDAADTLRSIYRQVYASGAGKHYGLTNEDEFLAELSSPDFREYLKQKNLWGRVVDAIKKIFGLDTENALEGAQAALEYILEHPDFGGAVDYNAIAIQYEGGAPQMLEASAEIGGEEQNPSTVGIDTPEQAETMHSIRVTDPDTLRFLNEQEKAGDVIHVYKSFAYFNGALYAPMAEMTKDENGKYVLSHGLRLGEWEESEGNPAKIKRNKAGKMDLKVDKKTGRKYGEFALKKTAEEGGGTVDAAYNPYQHASNSVLNDQFEAGYSRPRLVTVECIIPKSELTSKYWAPYAKDPVGIHEWHEGTVAGQLKNYKRMVYMSRWLKPVRVLGNDEVARMYKEILDNEPKEIKVPFNVVPPALLRELEKLGVAIDYEGSPNWRGNRAKQIPQEVRDSFEEIARQNLINSGRVNKRTGEPTKSVLDKETKAVRDAWMRDNWGPALVHDETDVDGIGHLNANDGSDLKAMYSIRQSVMTAEEAASLIDKEMGKGTAKKIKQTLRYFEQRAAKAEKQAEQARETLKAKQLLHKQTLKRAAAGSRLLQRAANMQIAEINRQKQQMQRKLDKVIKDRHELIKAAEDAQRDAEWRVKMAQSKGEQDLKEAQRIWRDKLNYNARTDKQWARGLYQSAVRETKKADKQALREAVSVERQVNSMAPQKAAQIKRRYENRAAQVLMNHGADVAVPMPFDSRNEVAKTAVNFRLAVEEALGKGYRMMVNALQGVDNFAKDQTRADNASVWVNVVRASRSTAERVFEVGLLDKAGNVIGPSMDEVLLIKDAKGRVDQQMQEVLNNYMFHLHNIDRMSLQARAQQQVEAYLDKHPWLRDMTIRDLKQYVYEKNQIVLDYVRLMRWANTVEDKAVLGWEGEGSTPVTAEESQRFIDEVKANFPEIVAKANAIYDWWDVFMREWAVGTSISMAQYQFMREIYPHYVPTFREFGDKKNRLLGPTMTPESITGGQVTKAAKGSTRKLIRMEDQYVKALRQIIRMNRQNSLLQNIIEEFLFDEEGVFAKHGFFDRESASQATAENFWEFTKAQNADSVEKTKDGMYKITCWVDGEKMSAYVNRSMFEGIAFLFDKSSDFVKRLTRIGNKITGPMKSMITGLNPFFAAKNIIRDQHTALVNSVAGLAFPKYLAQAAAKIARNDSDWITFQNLGGVSSSMHTMEGGFADAMDTGLNQIRSAKGIKKAGKAIKAMDTKVQNFLGTPGEISESMTRFAEYLATLDQMGGDTYEARMQGIRNAAEVTVDFGRRGTLGTVLNAWVPYWNPSVQGLDKAIRNIVTQPTVREALGRLGRAGVVNILPTALVSAALYAVGGWDEYEELSDQVKDSYYCIPAWWINPKWKHKWIKLPKSQDWASFISTPFMRMLEGVNGRDDPFENFFESALVPMLPFDVRNIPGLDLKMPGIFPLPLEMIFDLAENKNYAGSRIKPYDLLDASAKEQWDADTSVIAKALGQAFKMSPMAVDYVIKNYFGNFFGTVLSAIPYSPFSPIGYYTGEIDRSEEITDGLRKIMSPFVADTRYSNSVRANYYDLYSELRQRYTDAGAHGDPKDMEDYEFYKALTMTNGYADQITALSKLARDLPQGEEKDLYYEALAGLAAEALDFYAAYKSGKVTDPVQWMTYNRYGERILNETARLSKYEEEFNFNGMLGNPQTLFDRSGDLTVKYKLDADQMARYADIRAEQYQILMDQTIASSIYQGKTDAEKAALLEGAKRDALAKADELMLRELRDAGVNGQTIDKADWSYEKKAAAYSLAQILGTDDAYSEKITDGMLDLWDYREQFDFAPTQTDKETFNSVSDKTQVYSLSDSQSAQYSRMYHDTFEDFYTKVMNSEEYKAADDELRAEMLALTKNAVAKQTDILFDAWLQETGAESQDRVQVSDAMRQEAQYAVNRSLGVNNSYPLELTSELVRLYDYQGDFDFKPTDVSKKYFTSPSDDTKRYILSAEQSAHYAELYNENFTKYLLQVQNSAGYDRLSDEEKARRLAQAKTYAASDTNKEFGVWMDKQTDADYEIRGGDEVEKLDAKWDVQRILGMDNAIAAGVTDQLVGLYDLNDIGSQSFLPNFTAPTSYTYVNEQGKQVKGYKWILSSDQRAVYTSMFYDIYEDRMLQVINSGTFRQLDEQGQAMLLCSTRAQVTEDTRLAFQQWLRTSGAPVTNTNTAEAQQHKAEIKIADQIVDSILG